MKAMILAAGRGERMRPLTDVTPKALLRAGRKTLIEYHLEALKQGGVTDVVINLAWLGDKLRLALGNGGRYGMAIEYSHESPDALETGGGIFRALPLLGPEPFWVVNGDVHSDYTFADGQLGAADVGRLVLIANPEHNLAGDFALEGSRVSNVGEPMYTFSGISLLRPDLFVGQQDGAFPLAPLLRQAADAGQLEGELHAGVWIDVGTPERLAQVKELHAY